MLKYPDLALSYTKFIGFKIKKWKNNYNNLIFLNAETRLLLFLIEWAERDGIEENGSIRIENYLRITSYNVCYTKLLRPF